MLVPFFLPYNSQQADTRISSPLIYYLLMPNNLAVLFCALLLVLVLGQTGEDDLVDISQISMFPQNYTHKVYSGYLTISPLGNKDLHYFFYERYDGLISVASTIPIAIPCCCGSTVDQAVHQCWVCSMRTVH